MKRHRCPGPQTYQEAAGFTSDLSWEACTKSRSSHRTSLLALRKCTAGSAATTSSRRAVVIVEHAAEALAVQHPTGIEKVSRLWVDETIRQTLVIAFHVIVDGEILDGRPQRSLPSKITLSRQDSLMVRTNLSANAFRFGDRGGSLTDLTPTPASRFRNSVVNSGSRS